ncbi:MAG: DUF1802 family protein [Bryobacteraceae bacterium]
MNAKGGQWMEVNTALKEWASVIAALGTGRQVILLRKGGIVEAKRGFELLHPDFLLFPTFEHQHAASLEPEFHKLVVPPEGPGISIEYLARVTDIFPTPALITADHIWNDRFLTMRREYRPDLPLYLILVRVYRLAAASVIPNRPSYAGCKSWVNLTEEIDIAGAAPVLDDESYERRRDSITTTSMDSGIENHSRRTISTGRSGETNLP